MAIDIGIHGCHGRGQGGGVGNGEWGAVVLQAYMCIVEARDVVWMMLGATRMHRGGARAMQTVLGIVRVNRAGTVTFQVARTTQKRLKMQQRSLDNARRS